MDYEKSMNYDEMMAMKEKRRVSRSKGKKSFDETAQVKKKAKMKQMNHKNIRFDYEDEDAYDYDYK